MADSSNGSTVAAVPIAPDVLARRWWILAVLCTSLMLIIVGNTSLNVAIPTISRELGASTSELQWMVDAYALVFAGFLFSGGALGDRFGRKGALQLGLLIFVFGSLFAALQNSSWAVIAGRSIMGFGAAFVMPATLSIITNVFPPHERVKAIAVWAGIAGGGAAVGPIASGYLLQHFWWGSVFLVNVPIVIVALVAGWFILPTSRDPDHGRLDPVGAVFSIVGVSALVYAIIEAPVHGWASAESLAWFGGAIIVLGAFIWWELHSRHPMLSLGLFRDKRFSVASAGVAFVYFAMFGTFFLLTQYLQLVLGYDAFAAGLAGLPFAAVLMLVAPQTPRLANRIGVNRVVSLGMIMVAVGLTIFGRLQVDTPYLLLIVPMVIMACGMALCVSPLTGSIMSAVPLGRAGVGSAMNDTTRELGGALGVAVLGSIVASRYNSEIASAIAGLPPATHSLADSGLSGALEVSGQVGGAQGAHIASTAREAYVSGMSIATLVGAAVALIASVIVYRNLPSSLRAPVLSSEAEPTRAPVSDELSIATE
jgi:MFS transporter, DHA2 family, integral membrane protein